MNRSLGLFRTGFVVLALAAAGCGSSPSGSQDGGAGAKAGAGGGTAGKGGAGGTAGKGGSGGSGGAKGGAGGSAAGTSGGATAGTTGAGGEKTDGGGADAGPVLPASGLTATVLDRRATTFTLAWTAPATGGPTVTGYQVRYAKVPITSANFDDTTVSTAITYTGTPKASGTADGVTTGKLYIENGYYFAVEATDSAGAKSPIVATAAAVTAHFNVKMINSPTGTNQSFGATLDGSGDFNGDGLSDLLVGTFGDDQAYLFFGSATFSPTAPSVTFSGANMGFGSTVSRIGDIDHDGLQDLAITDSTGLQVFIYKGRTTWPATLTDAQADYVITSDATYVGSLFGITLAALGDLNGDGVDDFAIGAPAFNSRVGQVAVIYGQSGFTSFSLPSTTRALVINGDPALNRTQFGTAVVGLGHFYNLVTSTTMVVSATGLGTATTTTSNNEGRLYAFSGRGPGAAIAASAATNVRVGPAKGAEIGSLLSNLGPLVNSLPALGSGNIADASSVTGNTGTGFVLSGTAATGPLSNLLLTYQNGASISGQVFFGGGFSGLDVSVSLIGAAGPDLAITGETGNVDIFDGSKVAALTGPVDSKAVADVHVPLPSGWLGTAAGPGNLIHDINGDGYPDFALGDQFGMVPGSVGVFW